MEGFTVALASGARRLKTSPAQVHRLLDPANYTKTVDSMLDLLGALGQEVGVTVRAKTERNVSETMCAESSECYRGAAR